jgi:hypothetical protein
MERGRMMFDGTSARLRADPDVLHALVGVGRGLCPLRDRRSFKAGCRRWLVRMRWGQSAL